MADALTISGRTVKDQVRAVYAKLGVDNRVQAARIAWQADGGRTTGAGARAGHLGAVTGAVRRTGINLMLMIPRSGVPSVQNLSSPGYECGPSSYAMVGVAVPSARAAMTPTP